MKINSFDNFVNFKGATININALSDTHGRLERVDAGYQALMKNDAFIKEGYGRENFLITGGDWFISGGKKGFITDPDKPLMKFQAEMFNKFVGKIREKYPRLKSIFIPGNHDLDGGVDIFEKAIRDIDADVIATNLDFRKSYKLKAAIKEGKIIDSKITFVTDDKNENQFHPVLNLGIMPVNLSYYQSDLEGMELIDNVFTAQKFVKPEQYRKTMQLTRDEIDRFKKTYPEGKVILTCHTGVGFAENCAEQGGVDLIFDGHEHKDNIRFVNGCPIVALSQNFQKIVNAKITLDDNGRTKSIELKDIHPLNEKPQGDGEISAFYRELFKEDTKKVYTIKSTDKSLNKLSVENIRNRNNQLANFVCDAILDSIKQKDPTVQIFALNASAIRAGFKIGEKPTVSPFEISNCLDGINSTQADVYITDVTGRELAFMVEDNFLFNKTDTEKNPIIHYSGLKIDKTGFMNAHSKGKRGADLCSYITLQETGEGIDPDKTYRIANPEKYFIKTGNEKIKKMMNKSYPLYENVHDLFKSYFERNPETTFTPDMRLY